MLLPFVWGHSERGTPTAMSISNNVSTIDQENKLPYNKTNKGLWMHIIKPILKSI